MDKFTNVSSTTNFIRILIQRAHKALLSPFSNKENSDRISTPKHFAMDLNHNLNQNIEMRSNFNVAQVNIEKTEPRNWRYHLTNDHL